MSLEVAIIPAPGRGVLSVRLSMPGPLPRGVSPNDRVNRWERARSVKAWREAWHLEAGSAAREFVEHWPGPPPLPFVAAETRIEAFLCRGKWRPSDPLRSVGGSRPRDADNLIASMKGAQDGIVSAGWLAGDDATRVAILSPRLVTVETFRDERIEYVLYPRDERFGVDG
jgi:hypothetical protein